MGDKSQLLKRERELGYEFAALFYRRAIPRGDHDEITDPDVVFPDHAVVSVGGRGHEPRLLTPGMVFVGFGLGRAADRTDVRDLPLAGGEDDPLSRAPRVVVRGGIFIGRVGAPVIFAGGEREENEQDRDQGECGFFSRLSLLLIPNTVIKDAFLVYYTPKDTEKQEDAARSIDKNRPFCAIIPTSFPTSKNYLPGSGRQFERV